MVDIQRILLRDSADMPLKHWKSLTKEKGGGREEDYIPVIPALNRLRQEIHLMFEATLSNIVSIRLAWTRHQDPVSKGQKKDEEEGERERRGGRRKGRRKEKGKNEKREEEGKRKMRKKEKEKEKRKKKLIICLDSKKTYRLTQSYHLNLNFSLYLG